MTMLDEALNRPLENAIDILILSNGPGELTTWVKPVVRELRRRLGDDRDRVRISVVLSPCSNASGREAAIAASYPEVDRVQAAAHFSAFLLTGKTVEGWDWRDRGVVIFLGGDQFFPIVIGKRLGYRTVIYAEWEARWHRWGDRFGVMRDSIRERVAPEYQHKFAVVGDLMADASQVEAIVPPTAAPAVPRIGLLPGSKPMKLSMGVPLVLAIADHVHRQRPEVEFVIPVAPGLELDTLARYADPVRHPIIEQLDWGRARLITDTSAPYLETSTGLQVKLWQTFPAYDLLVQCQICVTTWGANTAELGSLGVPMIVIVPTQKWDLVRSWDGIPGLLMRLPGVGAIVAATFNWLESKQTKLRAWPNIWANREIVPELVGKLDPAAIATQLLDYLDHPEELTAMHTALRETRGAAGAASKLVQLVCEVLGDEGESPSHAG